MHTIDYITRHAHASNHKHSFSTRNAFSYAIKIYLEKDQPKINGIYTLILFRYDLSIFMCVHSLSALTGPTSRVAVQNILKFFWGIPRTDLLFAILVLNYDTTKIHLNNIDLNLFYLNSRQNALVEAS